MTRTRLLTYLHVPSQCHLPQRPPPKSTPRPPPVHQITAEHIRELRELIRNRYALDIEIWRQRNVREVKRPKVIANMRRSDAVLKVVRKALQDWDRREFFVSDLEHQKFVDIKDRVANGAKADWAKHPPWQIAQKDGNPYLGTREKYGSSLNGPLALESQIPASSIPQSQASVQQYVPHRPANRNLRYIKETLRSVNGASMPNDGFQHPVSEDSRNQQINFRGPPTPPPVEIPFSPSIRVPDPFD